MEYTGAIMTTKTINVIKDYSTSPYGRYSHEVEQGEEDTTGERFRKEWLVPALRQNDTVIVNLTGYNRYARSFIDEAFGGLISSGEFTLQDLQQKLIYQHDDLPSIVELIRKRIEWAEEMRHAENH